MSRRWIVGLCVVACADFGVAQADRVPFDEADAGLEFRLSEDGEILFQPNPRTGLPGDFTPLVAHDPEHVFSNAGVFGWLALVYRGDLDLASMADSEVILRRLGLSDDAELFQLILDDSPRRHRQLLRLLAVRRAAARGLKAAIGPIEKSLENGVGDPLLERAMRESIARLRGRGIEPWETSPIESALRLMTSRPDFVAKIDCNRLPALERLLAWGREVGLGITRQFILQTNGTVSASEWAGAVQLAEGIAAAPYELARRFGNHRATRILSVAIGEIDSDDIRQSTVVDGVFDYRALAAGVAEFGIETDLDDRRLRVEPLEGMTFEVSAERILSLDPDQAARMTDEEVAEFAELLDADGSQFVIWMRDAKLPMGLPPTLSKIGAPRRIAVRVPESADERLTFRVDFADEQGAKVVESMIGMLPREVEAYLDDIEPHESIDSFLDCFDEFTIEREDATVTVSMPVAGIDLDALLPHIARYGRM